VILYRMHVVFVTGRSPAANGTINYATLAYHA
jgi:hypothetical protein